MEMKGRAQCWRKDTAPSSSTPSTAGLQCWLVSEGEKNDNTVETAKIADSTCITQVRWFSEQQEFRDQSIEKIKKD